MEIKYLLNIPLTDSSPFALENRSNSVYMGYEKVDLSSSAVHLLSLWHLVELINEPFDQLGTGFQALINLAPYKKRDHTLYTGSIQMGQKAEKKGKKLLMPPPAYTLSKQ
ncbi:uncharacterized protein LOC117926602 [Vitis riparia]|uniref:uncharacterized protein LOC117926602 n=1 Tax=Vitis riparia TaxID=96939 RepID=UPI00155A87E7|nr:uncharacterized protein LOC117926602 [Vitis riparia]